MPNLTFEVSLTGRTDPSFKKNVKDQVDATMGTGRFGQMSAQKRGFMELRARAEMNREIAKGQTAQINHLNRMRSLERQAHRENLAFDRKRAAAQERLLRRQQNLRLAQRRQFSVGIGAGVFAGAALSPFGIAAGVGALSAGGATAAGAAIAIPATAGFVAGSAAARKYFEELKRGISLNSEFEKSVISLGGFISQFNDVPILDAIKLSSQLSDSMSLQAASFGLAREEATLTATALANVGNELSTIVALSPQFGAIIKTLTQGQPFERQILSETRAIFGLGQSQGAIALGIALRARNQRRGDAGQEPLTAAEFTKQNRGALARGEDPLEGIIADLGGIAKAAKLLTQSYEAQVNLLNTSADILERRYFKAAFDTEKSWVNQLATQIKIKTELQESVGLIELLRTKAAGTPGAAALGVGGLIAPETSVESIFREPVPLGEFQSGDVTPKINQALRSFLPGLSLFVDFAARERSKPTSVPTRSPGEIEAALTGPGGKSARRQARLADLAGEGEDPRLKILRETILSSAKLSEKVEGRIELLQAESKLRNEIDETSLRAISKNDELLSAEEKRRDILREELLAQRELVRILRADAREPELKTLERIRELQIEIVDSKTREASINRVLLEQTKETLKQQRKLAEDTFGTTRGIKSTVKGIAFSKLAPSQQAASLQSDLDFGASQLSGLGFDINRLVGGDFSQRETPINQKFIKDYLVDLKQLLALQKAIAATSKNTTMAVNDFNQSLMKPSERLPILIQQLDDARAALEGRVTFGTGGSFSIEKGTFLTPEFIESLEEYKRSLLNVKSTQDEVFAPIRNHLQGMTQDFIQAAIAGDNLGDVMRRIAQAGLARGASFFLDQAFSAVFSSLSFGGGTSSTSSGPVGDFKPGMPSQMATTRHMLRSQSTQLAAQNSFAPVIGSSAMQEQGFRDFSTKSRSVGGWQQRNIKNASIPRDTL